MGKAKRIIASLGIVTGTALCLYADRYFDLMGEADEFIKQENWEEAENRLVQALAERPNDPTNVMIYSNLGIAQYNLGKDSLALKSMARALEIAPTSTALLKNRADMYIGMGKSDAAYADYSEIIRLDSVSVEPLYMHAMLSINKENFDAAFSDCRRLAQIAPEDISTNVACASYYSAKEEWENAIPYYTKVIKKQPSPDMYAGRAVCYLMLTRLAEASADINSGLEIDPDNSELYMYRAHLNKMRYSRDDARRDMEKALRLSRRNSTAAQPEK